MEKILENGTVIKVEDHNPENCLCGKNGMCPFLVFHTWMEDPMERTRMTWHCKLEGREVDFLWDELRHRFDPRRTSVCLLLDPDPDIRRLALQRNDVDLVSYQRTHLVGYEKID